MEAISIGSDPNFCFGVGKLKISEGMKCLKDLVERYKDNFTPESAGRVHEIMAYLQSLQRQVVQVTLHTNVIWFVIINNWIFLSSQQNASAFHITETSLSVFWKDKLGLVVLVFYSSTFLSNISIWVLRLS
ncbi:hypothetical protein Patl1_26448 [Pistacia atlantica]|uniref:Uncharacterized protein n=1 Tax=Pistacia atlantica TaxID=434234 RepID=A0ACC1B0M2_9ROSI|nr:hypothetical protein Patl1_26448 [Pistacia atlantica]